MSVKYKKVINNRKNSATKGKVYGRAVVSNVVYTKEMAEKIGNRCTVTEPDILAVIAALGSEMASQLSQSNRVVLDGFGAFKVGITTKPADTAKKFTANNITGMHVIFQPAIEMVDKKRVKTMLKGAKVEELVEYTGVDDPDGTPGSTGSDGGNSQKPGGGSSNTEGGGSNTEGGNTESGSDGGNMG